MLTLDKVFDASKVLKEVIRPTACIVRISSHLLSSACLSVGTNGVFANVLSRAVSVTFNEK